jgi:uroporphyrinogen decarboxylase
MTSKERIQAVLAGRQPDRPPFSFWYHFPLTADPLPAHLQQWETYAMDFLKVMNDHPYPHSAGIQQIGDLAALRPLRGDEGGFGRQLELLSALKRAVGERVYLPTTIFNAWMVLRLLVQPPTIHRPPVMDVSADGPSRWIRQAYRQQPELVTQALETIGANLARFAARCVQAGADGIFLSVRDDWVDTPDIPGLYEQVVRPADHAILDAAREAPFNMLHVCGKAEDFRAFAEYPVPVLHWADRAAGPAIRDVAGWLEPALAGGVDNLGTLVSGTADQVRDEVLDALRQAGGRPMIIAPGCTFDPEKVPEANLRALAAAVGGVDRIMVSRP